MSYQYTHKESESSLLDEMNTLTNLTPKEIVRELDRFVVGQKDAKKAVSIALRNRIRRSRVEPKLRDEIIPKNILMTGPTGVGKTEIARRLAKLSGAPFIKVEVTKFTEVGYVGKDTESIIKDLVAESVNLVKKIKEEQMTSVAMAAAKKKILDILVGEEGESTDTTRKSFERKLDNGELEDKVIEAKISANKPSPMSSFDVAGGHVGIMNINDIFGKMLGKNKDFKKIKAPLSHIRKLLISQELEELIDEDCVTEEALELASKHGIVFLDEIDKITSRANFRSDVSREGVQRDLLPILEGCVVQTRYGPIKTDHILFIASGAFHISKPSDLLPELLGRLPIMVELKPLDVESMIKILSTTEYNLIRQYTALIAADNVDITFTDSGIRRIAEITIELNQELENIGARRLHTVMEKLLEEISFEAPPAKHTTIKIDTAYVDRMLDKAYDKIDLKKFIL